MRRYKLIESKFKALQLSKILESDNSAEAIIAKQKFDEVRYKTFKIDWNKIEKELGIIIPEGTVQIYNRVFGGNTFSLNDYIRECSSKWGLITLSSTLVLIIMMCLKASGIASALVVWVAIFVVLIGITKQLILTGNILTIRITPDIAEKVFKQMKQAKKDPSTFKREFVNLWVYAESEKETLLKDYKKEGDKLAFVWGVGVFACFLTMLVASGSL